MSLIIDIADAVATSLNAGIFSQPFTAVRFYQPNFELPDMETLRVSVVPSGIEIAGGTRSANMHDVSIDIAIQKKIDEGTNVEIDALMDLVEEISDYFRMKVLNGFPNAAWIRTTNSPIFSQEHMDQFRQFTSVLTLDFKALR